MFYNLWECVCVSFFRSNAKLVLEKEESMKVLDAEITFHAVALIFNLCVSQYALYCVDFSKTNDPLVLEMKQFQYRYLTTWNWVSTYI